MPILVMFCVQISMSDKSKTIFKYTMIFFLCFFWVFALVLFLNSKAEQPQEKTEFTIQTTTIDQIDSSISLEKPGTILSSQDITVAAQANGKVSRIAFKEGNQVKGWDQIVYLSDTVASYELQVQRAKNNLDRALLTREQTENSLKQQLDQAENSYKTALQSFEAAQVSAENAVKQANMGVTSADDQISALRKQFQPQKLALLSLLNSVIESSDKWLGVTKYYDDLKTGFEIYIWAKDQSQKNQTEQALRDLYTLKESITKLPSSPKTDEELKSAVHQIDAAYTQIEDFAGMMIQLMRNSIPSAGTLDQATIDATIRNFESIQAGQALIGSKASFISYLNQVDAQLSGSGTLAQDSAKITYEDALARSKNTLFTSEITVKNAKVNYETLLANNPVQLRLLDNAIVDAKIAYESALTQYNKLVVRTPVSGIIGEILVSEGQDVAAGNPVFKVSGLKKHQIEVHVTANEYKYLQQDKPVSVTYQGQSLTGAISAISTVADKTNLFKVTIELDSDLELVGDVAKVNFPILFTPHTLLPLERVKILEDNLAAVPVMSGGALAEKLVKIKTIWGNFIELEEPFPADQTIVTTDMSSFDENKYVIK